VLSLYAPLGDGLALYDLVAVAVAVAVDVLVQVAVGAFEYELLNLSCAVWTGVIYPALKRRACTTGITGGEAAFASSPVPGFRGGAGAVDGAPRRHNSHALARMLREPLRSA
jgi:hypothetical protein